ncbi:hypothetical protein PAXRUDRAFT_231430 [Paxillus rubicundulus Ve08.2h10]|uniref:Uncharacterized protein n=1 Tax=Paxillus rubicundulus Ve08.2h10 TaxID=930991 RepID=A0A0D0DGU2_9AGAM|nr:hypothetical protein PAXRUDRAFT_231430 [Paxillus rubicundulus Ve08.2h10]
MNLFFDGLSDLQASAEASLKVFTFTLNASLIEQHVLSLLTRGLLVLGHEGEVLALWGSKLLKTKGRLAIPLATVLSAYPDWNLSSDRLVQSSLNLSCEPRTWEKDRRAEKPERPSSCGRIYLATSLRLVGGVAPNPPGYAAG